MYIQRPPKWLWENYCRLYHNLKEREFEFNQALAILKISRGMMLKTLSELEKQGLLTKHRSEYEHRIKKYRLIPKSVVELIEDMTIDEKREKDKLNLAEKLEIIKIKLKFIITGSTCAYYYHKYIIPPRVFELKVQKEDQNKWIFFLTDKNTRVYTQEKQIPSNEKHRFIARLYSNLNEEEYSRKQDNYQSKEDLIFDLINKRSRLPVIEAISIILTNKINWGLLLKIFKGNPLQKELGAVLDIVYNEDKRLVPIKIIKTLEKHKKEKRFELFPTDIKEQCNDFKELSEKWNLSIILPKHDIDKIFEDLKWKK